jgi:hypothetical protein
MPILVKHSGNVSPAAWAAFAGGRGRRQFEDSRQALDVAERGADRNFRASQANMDRMARESEANRNRAFQAGQADISRKFSREQSDTAFDRSRTLSDDAFERSLDLRDYDFLSRQDENDANEQRMRERFDWQYTQKQKQEFDQLTNAYEEAKKSGEFTPDELKDLHYQIAGRMAGIDKLPRLKQESPWPQGQGVGETWHSEDGRFLLSRDEKGNIKKIAETSATPTVQDIAKLYEQGFKALSKENEDGGVVAPSEKDVEAYVDRAIKLHQRYSGAPKAGGAAPSAPEFDPEGRGSDLAGIAAAGFEPDEQGRTQVVDPDTGRIMIGSKNPDFRAVEEDAKKNGRAVVLRHGNYYSVPIPSAEVPKAAQEMAQSAPSPISGEGNMNPVRISTNSEYDALAKGTPFIGPDGKLRRKP